MKRKRRRRPIFFRYYDCDVFADYLAKQAKKGWHFAEFRMGMIFEKGEPADREYAVEVFPKGSEWETGPTVETEEYAQYCEAAGWKFVDSTRKFCVFEKIREDAETIVTDEERLENIWKAQRVNHILDVLLEASYIGSWMWASGLSSALYFDQMSLLWFLLCLGILAVSAGDFAVHLIWYLRQRKRLYQGKEIQIGGKAEKRCRTIYLAFWVMAGIAATALFLVTTRSIFSWVLMGFLITVVLGDLVISWIRPDDAFWAREITIFCLWVVYLILAVGAIFLDISQETDRRSNGGSGENPPLTQEDYRSVSGTREEADYEVRESILGRWEHASVLYVDGEREDRIEYDVYRSRYDFVLDQAQKYQEYGSEYREERTDAWKAETVWREDPWYGTCYLVRYEDALLYFYAQEPLTDDQIVAIRRELDL